MKAPIRDEAQARFIELLGDISAQNFCQRTGFSKAQHYAWFTLKQGSGGRNPSLNQFVDICYEFDISPSYVFFGLGLRKLSAIENLWSDGVGNGRVLELARRVIEDKPLERIYDQLTRIEAKIYEIDGSSDDAFRGREGTN